MKLRPLDDEASAGFLLYAGVALFFLGFLFIATGVMVDNLVTAENALITSDLPVSQDRIDVINFILLVFKAWPLGGIIVPLGLYMVIVGIREKNSVVG